MPRAPKFPESAIVYQGPSTFDGAPIVAIATGLDGSSKNPKTGRMAQLYIMRADMDPVTAIQTGADISVCWTCKLKPSVLDVCYVVAAQAPLSIYKAFVAGNYQAIAPEAVAAHLNAKQLPIRFGAYGEPPAVPAYVLHALANGTEHTGYSHQWDVPSVARQCSPILMASVDTPEEYERANALGWRTFRTRAETDPLFPGEIACPASPEMNHRTVCADCNLCDGKHDANDRRRNIAIMVHGAKGKKNHLKVLRYDGSVIC